MSARHKPIEASELWVWRKSIDEDSCAEIEVTVAERDGLRADVERLTAARDAAYSDGVSAAEARLKTERDQLRAELAAVENLVDALNTQRGEDAVAAMRAVEEAEAAAKESRVRGLQIEGLDHGWAKAEARVKELEAEREPWRIDAQKLADEVDLLVRRRVIDARSPAADALLDFRNPPMSPRSDRMKELEAERDALKADLVRLKELLRRALPSVQHYNLKALTDDILKESNHE